MQKILELAFMTFLLQANRGTTSAIVQPVNNNKSRHNNSLTKHLCSLNMLKNQKSMPLSGIFSDRPIDGCKRLYNRQKFKWFSKCCFEL